MDIKQMAFFCSIIVFGFIFVSKKSHCPILFLKSLNYYSIQLVQENFLQVHTLAFYKDVKTKRFYGFL
jgi:hypothetical protein